MIGTSTKKPRLQTEVLGINRRNLDFVFADYRPGAFRELDDKVLAKENLRQAGIATPATVAILHHLTDLSDLQDILAEYASIVLKPANGYGGRGILVLERQAERWLSPSGEVYHLGDLIHHCTEILAGSFSLDESADCVILEERVYPHAFATGFYPDGLADLRIVVEKGKPLQAMCRLPTSLSDGKANLHGGGVGVGIDMRTGLTTDGICQGKRVTRHPDSQVSLAGHRIPDWELCLELARAASHVVDVDYLGVDIVLDRDRGPLILELNARPGLAIQLANDQPQPVRKRTTYSRLDQLTFAVAMMVLVMLTVAPFLHRLTPDTFQTQSLHLPAPPGTAIAAGEETTDEAPSNPAEWSSEATSLSEENADFRAARAAIAAGDTARALQRYMHAARDSSIAPFALNNVALIRRSRGEWEGARKALEEAIALYPGYNRGYYNLGLVLRDMNRDDEAMAAFQRTIAGQPSHARSWAALGDIHFDRGELDQAVACYEHAIQYKPNSQSYRQKLGLTHRLQGDYQAASERFAETLALDGGHEPAAYWWARSQLDMRRLALTHGADGLEGAATVPLDSLMAVLRPHSMAMDASSRCRSVLAMVQWEAADLLDALSGFARLTKKGYKRRYHARAAAAVALELGCWSVAEEHLEHLDAHSQAFVSLAREQITLGRSLDAALSWSIADAQVILENTTFDTAILELVRRVVMDDDRGARHLIPSLVGEEGSTMAMARWLSDPLASTPFDVPHSWLWVAPVAAGPYDKLEQTVSLPLSLKLWIVFRVASAQGNHPVAAAAEQILQEHYADYQPLIRDRFFAAAARGKTHSGRRLGAHLLQRDPKDAEVLMTLADLHAQAGEPEKAQYLMKRLSQRQRQQNRARVVQARILWAQGHVSQSLDILKEICRRSPQETAAWMVRSQIESKQGRVRQAIASARTALEQEPGRLDFRRHLARQFMKNRQYEEAVAEWRRILQLGSGVETDRFNLALSLQRDKQYIAAIQNYDVILAGNAQHARALFNRSLAYEKLGDLLEARKGYRKVLVLDPGHSGSLERLVREKGASE